MGDIWASDKLILFIFFVIPGFISLKIYELLIPSNKIESSKLLIDAIAYSSINYALLTIPILKIEASTLKETAPMCYYLFYFFVLLIAPILWALIWKWLRTREFFQKNAPHPTLKPWDFVFAQRKPYWIKITLKDGTKILGKYSDNSFASNYPSDEQIYLEEVWTMNEEGGFNEVKERTEGVIIISKDISYIELFKFQ